MEYTFTYIPKNIKLYTPEKPGPLSSLFNSGDIVRMVNPDFHDENISINQSGKNRVTENDIKEYKASLDRNPNKPIPAFRNVSVKFIKIGKEKNKTAVEHIYQMKGNIPGIIRQVFFSHKNRGFIITCGTAIERFQLTNTTVFDPLLNSMVFMGDN